MPADARASTANHATTEMVTGKEKLMRVRKRSKKLIAVSALFLLVLAFVALGSSSQDTVDRPNTGMADPDALVNAFDRYVSNLSTNGGGSFLEIPLTGLRGLTSGSFNAGGTVRINLTNGSVFSHVTGLPSTDTFDLWLIDNRTGSSQSTFAELQDVTRKVETYYWDATRRLHTLPEMTTLLAPTGFFPDRAVVVASNQNPLGPFVLTGSSTTFDRLLHRQVRFIDGAGSTLGFDPNASRTRKSHLPKLVAQGREVFLDEKFSGNGRACGTCHVENNNFTIDPEFISNLPRQDPLFVAETNPALAGLENPALMRDFGLILVNAD